MTALLTADEVARLRVGVKVIVRPGDSTRKIAARLGLNHAGRIVPLYTECPKCEGEGILGINLEPPDQGIHWCDCDEGRVLVGWGSIEVVPVVRDMEDVGGAYEGPACIEVNPATGYCRLWPAWSGALEYDDGTDLTLDPLPVPGRDFGIVIDVTELA